MNSNQEIVWDLSDLFDGMDDPHIPETLNNQKLRAQEFGASYRGKIDAPDVDAPLLYKAIKEYESILQESIKPLDFAALLFAADTSKPERGAFFQKMQEHHTEITVSLIFFELELMAVPEEKISRLLENPCLTSYSHYIQAVRLFRDYRLSEPEEKLLEEKANTGRRAFSRLFEETVSNIPFKLDLKGEARSITLAEIVNLLRDADRETRRAAASSLTDGLISNNRTLVYTFNTLIQDKAVDDRLRDFSYPEQSRHLANQLDAETVELVVCTAVENYDLVSKYYNLKKEILGYDELTHYDRYAPLFKSREEMPFEKAKSLILKSFGDFSPELEEVARMFFDKQWIDAEVRKGKRGGAFCSYVTPDLHPYILLSYMNRLDDVMTLGHELGHGVHAYLARDKGYLNFSSVLPLAELASTFGEMLVFEALQLQGDRESRLALYAEKIEGMFATIFRQAAMYRFEKAIHAHRRDKGELRMEEFGTIWQEEIQAMFGDSVELGEEHRHWWMYISHFVESPFYVYAYTFGELLVLALYAMYKREGKAFSEKYLDLLRIGGSLTPADTLATVGIDMHDPVFWSGGMEVLQGFIQQFDSLYRDWRA